MPAMLFRPLYVIRKATLMWDILLSPLSEVCLPWVAPPYYCDDFLLLVSWAADWVVMATIEHIAYSNHVGFSSQTKWLQLDWHACLVIRATVLVSSGPRQREPTPLLKRWHDASRAQTYFGWYQWSSCSQLLQHSINEQSQWWHPLLTWVAWW